MKVLPLEANSDERLTGDVNGSRLFAAGGETSWEGETYQ